MVNIQDKRATSRFKRPPKSPQEKGIGFGIKMWILFMVTFGVLGYSTGLSILFGVIGGIASGLTYMWWHILDVPEQTPSTDAQKTLAYVAENRFKTKHNPDFKQ
jgi:hypothetical protein